MNILPSYRTFSRWVVAAAAVAGAAGAATGAAEDTARNIKVPDGFKIETYAKVTGARSMVLSPKGTLFVGTGGFSDTDRAGRVWAVRDTNGDGKGNKVTAIAKGLKNPNGVALKGGDLYIAEISRISRIKDVESKLDKTNKPKVIYDKFPRDRSHGWKYIAFGPDGKLYVPVGAPGNVVNTDCESGKKGRYSRLFALDVDSKAIETYASGIRNTVGFDWHPTTGHLWFTDNGRDNLGDNIPPDELNTVTEKGQHFGYPHRWGKNKKDDEGGKDCLNTKSYKGTTVNLGPHVAALGMTFYEGDKFPAEYKNQIFIAEHGSWNRKNKIGYRLSLVKEKGNGKYSYEPFATGWLSGKKVTGRPVDVINDGKGGLFMSSDRGGYIYRITYTGKKQAKKPAKKGTGKGKLTAAKPGKHNE